MNKYKKGDVIKNGRECLTVVRPFTSYILKHLTKGGIEKRIIYSEFQLKQFGLDKCTCDGAENDYYCQVHGTFATKPLIDDWGREVDCRCHCHSISEGGRPGCIDCVEYHRSPKPTNYIHKGSELEKVGEGFEEYECVSNTRHSHISDTRSVPKEKCECNCHKIGLFPDGCEYCNHTPVLPKTDKVYTNTCFACYKEFETTIQGKMYCPNCPNPDAPKTEECEEKYNELIMAVENKHEGETRHQTALRYIKEAEIVYNTALPETTKLGETI